MLRVFTTFSGYDSQCLALDRLGIDYDLVGWSEIDRYAIQAHNALFPNAEGRNFGDITKIDWSSVPDFDLLTYSSPCQDFSQAGLQKGGAKGSGTRSSLLWEVEKAIATKRPKFLLMENVAALVSSKFVKLFNKWQYTLERYGYTNYAKVLNAKDYGVPQNRDRIFLISILNGDRFYFPKPITLKKRLKDVIETNANEEYYLKNTTTEGIARAIMCNYEKVSFAKLQHPTHDKSTYVAVSQKQNVLLGWSRSSSGVTKWHPVNGANCVTAKKRDNTQNYLFDIGVSKAHLYQRDNCRIRKLTPRECFRLMGLTDSEIYAIQAANISNSQQYKLAGNSIVVDVLAAIFRKMFIDSKNESPQLTLF